LTTRAKGFFWLGGGWTACKKIGMKHKLTVFGLALAAVVIAADQVSKWWMLQTYGDGGEGWLAATVTPFFNLVLVWNHGVSFGMFGQHGGTDHDTIMPYLLIALAAVLAAVVTRWLLRAEKSMEAAAFGLIIGGAIGNVIDRIRLGAVLDFLDFHIREWHYPAFNIADSAIVVGAGIILFLWGARAKTKA